MGGGVHKFRRNTFLQGPVKEFVERRSRRNWKNGVPRDSRENLFNQLVQSRLYCTARCDERSRRKKREGVWTIIETRIESRGESRVGRRFSRNEGRS